MGQGPSKEKEFLPNAHVSQALFEQIQSNTETDYTRLQKSVKDKAEKSAENLKKELQKHIAQTEQSAKQVKESDDKQSQKSDGLKIKTELDNLDKKLAKHLKRGSFDKTGQALRDELAKCRTESKGQNLKCRAILDKFEEHVKQAEQSLSS